MNTSKSSSDMLPQIIDIVVRLSLVLALIVWSFLILAPFLMPVIWGIILAVASYPGYQMLSERLGDRKKLAAVIVCGLMLLVIIIPSWLLADSLVAGVSAVKSKWESGMLVIPPPTEQVKEWPLIGGKVFDVWSLASKNLEAALRPLAPQLKSLVGGMLSTLAGAGIALVQFVFSIIIAGALLANSKQGEQAALTLSKRLASDRGTEIIVDAEVTVRNVARGILGVAVIQAILAGIGFVAAGIPGAGLWALVCLVLGIIQIGVAPVMIISCIYLFSTASAVTAGLFLVWTIIVCPLDNILKPLLLGKGAPAPMLVIFLGALGGFIQSGIIGLFVGAVILSLAYKLLLGWIKIEA